MSNRVLDCSFCAALFLPHEKSGAVKDIFRSFSEDAEILVPVRFWDEMAELLLTAVNRGRLKHADALEINRLLTMFRFSCDSRYSGDYTEKLLELAGLYSLSAANAAYLELAIRSGAALGTLNGSLRTACIQAGIDVLL